MATSGRRGRGRGFSITRLRRWLLAGVIVLAVALTALIGFARWKTRKLLHDLPARLGADIKTQANGFTYSQSVKGRTLFTIHAAKAIQRQDGKTTLHDVAITLFGPEGSNRNDSITGKEFEYDQPNGIVKAMGEVHLDLASPADAKQSVDAKRIVVTTSGLIFLQKLGVAATDQPMQVVYGDLHGSAVGAEYETDAGILRLRSRVAMDGTQSGQQVHVTASAAELDRTHRLATLHTAVLHTGDSTASGDTVVLDAGPSGGIDEIRVDGHTVVQSADGMKAEAPKLVAKISEAGKPTLATMTGGVVLASSDGNGTAQTAVLHFTGAGVAESVQLSGGVDFHQNSEASTDHLTAEQMVAALTRDAQQHTVLKDATATGHAQLRSVANGSPARVTTVRAETLHAVMAGAGGKRYVATLNGTGATHLDEDDGKGTTRSSAGDTLLIRMLPPGAGKRDASVQSAMQDGHVTVATRAPAKDGKGSTETHAVAAHADFEGASGKLLLTGSPMVTGDGLQLAADRIAITQGGGDADATGNVRGVYRASNQRDSDPVHVTSAHAVVSGSVAKFFGAERAARMWTSTSQLEAPVIEVDRSTSRLMAHAATAGVSGSVRLLLPESTTTAGKKTAGVMRITGGSLLYVPAEAGRNAHADVTGGVRMETAGAQLSAQQAVATLSAGPKAGALSGSVQQIVASGSVNLAQPGRTGHGDRLVYTAADGRYVLTGTPQSPPRVTDSQKGTITGTTLVLHAGDESVEVEGAGHHRVETDVEAPPRK